MWGVIDGTSLGGETVWEVPVLAGNDPNAPEVGRLKHGEPVAKGSHDEDSGMVYVESTLGLRRGWVDAHFVRELRPLSLGEFPAIALAIGTLFSPFFLTSLLRAIMVLREMGRDELAEWLDFACRRVRAAQHVAFAPCGPGIGPEAATDGLGRPPGDAPGAYN